MNFEAFKESLQSIEPPEALSVYTKALWHDGKEDWDRAHQLIQDLEDKTAAWIHAYLHRKEGDIWNADYWYARAKRTRPAIDLHTEWEQLCKTLL